MQHRVPARVEQGGKEDETAGITEHLGAETGKVRELTLRAYKRQHLARDASELEDASPCPLADLMTAHA
jgi:hypothetical protein